MEAVKAGANFNVSRDIYASDLSDLEDDDEIMFSFGGTPLHEAAAYNHDPESVKFLISLGLDVNAEGSEGLGSTGTPLTCAVGNKNLPAMTVLLEAGADPNYWSMSLFYMGTAFHDAASMYEDDAEAMRFVIESLVKAGGNVNIHDDFDDETRESIADELKAGGWDSAILKDGKVDPSDPFRIGELRLSRAGIGNVETSCTPLIYAVLYDNPDAVNALLDYGADVRIRNIEGKTAMDYARALPKDSRLRKSSAYARLKKTKRN